MSPGSGAVISSAAFVVGCRNDSRQACRDWRGNARATSSIAVGVPIFFFKP